MAKTKQKCKINWDMTRVGLARYKDNGYKMYYTLVKEGKKRLKGKVEEVSIKDFLDGVDIGNEDYSDTLEQIKGGRKISMLVDDKIHGRKYDVRVALACKELGVDKAPCLVCGGKKKEK